MAWATAAGSMAPRSGGREKLRLRGGRPAQQSFGAEMFVNRRPLNSVAAAADAPTETLRFGRLQQSWIPCERDTNAATIHQIDGQRVARQLDVLDSLIAQRSAHRESGNRQAASANSMVLNGHDGTCGHDLFNGR